MKNTHVLPTDKPSRFQKTKHDNLFLKSKIKLYTDCIAQHIYITNDEEIKDVRPHKGKWQLEQGHILNKFPTYLTDLTECKLVIMTTDQNLINDGVQAIDDEFLEWFVKNPSCERVEIIKQHQYHSSKELYIDADYVNCSEEQYESIKKEIPTCPLRILYKIIIPTKEPKQETIEEVAHEMLVDYGIKSIGQSIGVLTVKKLMVNMAKWQQERMHSEVIEFAEWCDDMGYTQVANSFWKSLNDEKGKTTKELFEQFKKK
jgi:hypothetical protein